MGRPLGAGGVGWGKVLNRSLRKRESSVGAGDVAFYLRAGVFDELVVLDAGGAGGHAGHAAEALVHVGAEVLVEGGFALRGPWPSCRCGRGGSPSLRPRGRRWGQAGRQKPQWTQSERSSFSGAWWASKELGLVIWMVSVCMVLCVYPHPPVLWAKSSKDLG